MEVNPNCDHGNILLNHGNKNQAEAGRTLQISGHVYHAPLQYEMTFICRGLLTHTHTQGIKQTCKSYTHRHARAESAAEKARFDVEPSFRVISF